MRITADRLNETGVPVGNLRRRIRLVVRDNESNPATAAKQATEMIRRDGVHAILGGTTPETSMSIVKVVQEEQVPFLSLASSDDIVIPLPDRTYVYKLTPDAADVAKLMAPTISSLNVARIGVIATAGAHGDSGIRAMQGVAAANKLQIVGSARIPATGSNVSAAARAAIAGKPRRGRHLGGGAGRRRDRPGAAGRQVRREDLLRADRGRGRHGHRRQPGGGRGRVRRPPRLARRLVTDRHDARGARPARLRQPLHPGVRRLRRLRALRLRRGHADRQRGTAGAQRRPRPPARIPGDPGGRGHRGLVPVRPDQPRRHGIRLARHLHGHPRLLDEVLLETLIDARPRAASPGTSSARDFRRASVGGRDRTLPRAPGSARGPRPAGSAFTKDRPRRLRTTEPPSPLGHPDSVDPQGMQPPTATSPPERTDPIRRRRDGGKHDRSSTGDTAPRGHSAIHSRQLAAENETDPIRVVKAAATTAVRGPQAPPRDTGPGRPQPRPAGPERADPTRGQGRHREQVGRWLLTATTRVSSIAGTGNGTDPIHGTAGAGGVVDGEGLVCADVAGRRAT